MSTKAYFFPFPFMNRSSSVAVISMTVVFLLPLSAFALVKVPTVEPSSVFITGPLPAWSARHTDSGMDEHRNYHKQSDADLQLWKNENKSLPGTEEYTNELRAALVQRGHEHQAFHHWNDDTDAQKTWREAYKNMVNQLAATSTHPVNTVSKTASQLLAEGNYFPILPERRFEGSKPSSRLMRELARVRGLSR